MSTTPDHRRQHHHRRLLRDLLAATFAAVVAVGVLAPPASALPTGKDNTAIAVNTKDGSSLFRFAFSITRVTGGVVDAGNAAVAYASCTQCQTVAIAIQIVLVEGSPDVFTPTNLAIAINSGCTACDTLATAYQFVFQSSGRLELTPDGHKRLKDILKQIKDLRDSGLSAPELQARVDVLAKEIYTVFSTELRVVGKPPSDGSTTVTGGASSSTTATSTASSSTTVRPATTTAPSTSTSTSSSASTATTTAPTTTATSAP